jgi:hypothetical protein
VRGVNFRLNASRSVEIGTDYFHPSNVTLHIWSEATTRCCLRNFPVTHLACFLFFACQAHKTRDPGLYLAVAFLRGFAASRANFKRESETFIRPHTYSPIHLLFFFLPFLVAVLHDRITPWYTIVEFSELRD